MNFLKNINENSLLCHIKFKMDLSGSSKNALLIEI